jgi:hypothetical protein
VQFVHYGAQAWWSGQQQSTYGQKKKFDPEKVRPTAVIHGAPQLNVMMPFALPRSVEIVFNSHEA